ncbi:hypothetical protein ACH5RR_009426 [Cinchona calisaya]|uniref:C2H2-type domain-containing protein n=1 Tax=Cinchona calisaya TaxID=153742 RepID=A0ABD3AG04_9GENT
MDRNLGKEKQSASPKEGENHQENQQEPKEVAARSCQTPDSSGGKMLLKLKFPKSSQEIVKNESASSPVAVKSHICQECHKGFSSGKALGGHMSSAHVQARDHHIKKLKINKSTKFKKDGSSRSAGTSSPIEETLCRICGKDFQSRKSLYGHMRCHPERDWRGMEPPKEFKKIYDQPSESLRDEDEDDGDEGDHVDSATRVMIPGAVVDLTASLSRWGSTGMRGRHGLKPSIRNPPLADEEERKLRDAVSHLMTLCNGDPKYHSEEDEFAKDEVIVDDSSTESDEIKDFPVKKRKFRDDLEETLDGVLDLGKGKAPVEQLFSDEKSSSYQSKNNNLSAGNELDCEKIELQNHNVVVKKRRTGQKGKTMSSRTPPVGDQDQKEMDASKLEVTPKEYKCNTCGKSFSSHQALGGHRSSHNKLLVNVQNTSDNQESSPLTVGEIHANSSTQLLEKNEIEEVVDGSNGVQKVLNFDLNDEPPETEE